MAPKTNVKLKVPADAVTRQRARLLARWRRAHWRCTQCSSDLEWIQATAVWACPEHGDQWSGEALAILRGFALMPHPEPLRAKGRPHALR